MKIKSSHGFVLLAALYSPVAHAADIGTAFTYQGHLENGSGPVTDDCDFRFGLWSDSFLPVGLLGPVTVNNVSVENGIFTVQIDFGADAFHGFARWLEIEVQCPGDGAFVLLSPRVELTPAPHALALPGLYTQENATSPNIVGGFAGNTVAPGIAGATIDGGGQWLSEHRIFSDFSTVGGGLNNKAGDSANPSSTEYATVSGGRNNNASGSDSTVSGGRNNTASGKESTVGGGFGNTASDNTAIVGGGEGNSASNFDSTIGGGYSNSASGFSSTIGGGTFGLAIGDGSTISGGSSNTTSGYRATVPGGENNDAGGAYSLAAGRRAIVRDAATTGDADGDNGTFIWADSTDADFASTGPNQFLIRAFGGVGIGTNAPGSQLDVAGEIRSTGATGGLLRAENPNNAAASVHLSWLDDVARIRYGGSGTGSQNGLDIQGGGDSSKLRILNNGNVGIGTITPETRLHLSGGSDASLGGGGYMTMGSTTSANIAIDNNEIIARNNGAASSLSLNTDGGNINLIPFNTGNVGVGTDDPSAKLHVVGDIVYTGTITDISDKRLKQNIAPVENATSKIHKLRGVYFNMTDTPDVRDVGLIAQDVQAVLPEAVRVVDRDRGYLGVAYPSVIPLLVEAIKEQDDTIAEKNCRIEELEARLARVEALLNASHSPEKGRIR